MNYKDRENRKKDKLISAKFNSYRSFKNALSKETLIECTIIRMSRRQLKFWKKRKKNVVFAVADDKKLSLGHKPKSAIIPISFQPDSVNL